MSGLAPKADVLSRMALELIPDEGFGLKPRCVAPDWRCCSHAGQAMKTKIELEYNPVFVGVARRIAKGEPPLWLLISLTHFSRGIGTDTSDVRKQFKNAIERMHD